MRKLPRTAIGATFLIATMAALALAARAAASDLFTGWGLLVSVPGAFLAIVCAGSLYEWVVHCYLYHSRSRFRMLRLIHEIHERGHHWNRFPPDRYVHPLPIERIPVLPAAPLSVCGSRLKRLVAWYGQFALYVAVAVPFAFLPAWLVSRNWLFTSSAIAMGLVLCYLFIAVHDAIHYPAERWIEGWSWFRFLDRHHYLHHVNHGTNLNFLLPLGDLLLGTLRLELNPNEVRKWPSFEDAKRTH